MTNLRVVVDELRQALHAADIEINVGDYDLEPAADVALVGSGAAKAEDDEVVGDHAEIPRLGDLRAVPHNAAGEAVGDQAKELEELVKGGLQSETANNHE